MWPWWCKLPRGLIHASSSRTWTLSFHKRWMQFTIKYLRGFGVMYFFACCSTFTFCSSSPSEALNPDNDVHRLALHSIYLPENQNRQDGDLTIRVQWIKVWEVCSTSTAQSTVRQPSGCLLLTFYSTNALLLLITLSFLLLPFFSFYVSLSL